MAVRFLDSGPADAAPVASLREPAQPRASGLRRVGQFQTPYLDRLASEGPAFDREPAAPPTIAAPEPPTIAPAPVVSRETPERRPVPAAVGLRSVGIKPQPAVPDQQAAFDALPWTERAGAQLQSGV